MTSHIFDVISIIQIYFVCCGYYCFIPALGFGEEEEGDMPRIRVWPLQNFVIAFLLRAVNVD